MTRAEKLLERANQILDEDYQVSEIRSRQVKAALKAVAEMFDDFLKNINLCSCDKSEI